jgi:hypothetical protein
MNTRIMVENHADISRLRALQKVIEIHYFSITFFPWMKETKKIKPK